MFVSSLACVREVNPSLIVSFQILTSAEIFFWCVYLSLTYDGVQLDMQPQDKCDNGQRREDSCSASRCALVEPCLLTKPLQLGALTHPHTVAHTKSGFVFSEIMFHDLM
jgi:hypothetical protein